VCDEAGGDKSYGVDAGTFQRVKNSCGMGRTFEVLQFVFIGGAVLSSGLSAYLLLGPRTEQPSFGTRTFTLHPTVGKSGASLGARFKF
jgi:hypothetical protein